MDRISKEQLVDCIIDFIQRDRFSGNVSQDVADKAIKILDQMYGTDNSAYYFVE